MNKADEKKLHADPRCKMAVAAHLVLVDALRKLDAAAEVARSEYLAAGGLPFRPLPSLADSVRTLDDSELFEAFRPRGDKCRVKWSYDSEYRDTEIESVTAQRIAFGGGRAEFNLAGGGKRGGYNGGHIHPDDLIRIKNNELRGWRQKSWGEP